MGKFVLNRVGQALLTVVIVTILVFAMARVSGNPIDILLPIGAPPEAREAMTQQLGLNGSLIEQFLRYVGSVLQGDLGESYTHRVPVIELFADRIVNTLLLVIPAFVIAIIFGPALGVVGATSKSRIVRRGSLLLATFGIAAPAFWLGLVLVRLFAVQLGWLPAGRMGGLDHYVLPVATLSLLLISGMMRLVRSNILDAMGRDYVKMARIKGVSEQSIRWKHALRNSLSSALAFLSVYMATLITGAVVVEKVFAWPGVGLLLFDAVVGRNYTLVQGIILLGVIMVVTLNTLFDVAQAYLDPTVRLQGSGA